MSKTQRVLVTGYQGMVGSALARRLTIGGYKKLYLTGRNEINLLDANAIQKFLINNSIEQIYLAAAKVGGIYANHSYPGEFIYQNLMIACNVIHAAHQAGIQKLLFLGSSCIYPRQAPQPIKEEALLSGQLESTNEPYAIAKIAGIKLCESYNRQYGRDYRCVMPTNLYGPHDNFHLEHAHVIPALIRRFHAAVQNKQQELIIWGTGTPRREFLHVDDLADACVYLMEIDENFWKSYTQPMCSHLNIGTGQDCTIRELAEIIAKVTGFTGTMSFDPQKPDGPPRKLLDISRLQALGWQAKRDLFSGLQETYAWFLDQQGAWRNA